MNTQGTSGDSVTVGLPRYELIDKDGKVVNTAGRASFLAEQAAELFPDQKEDSDETGEGWHIRVVGP